MLLVRHRLRLVEELPEVAGAGDAEISLAMKEVCLCKNSLNLKPLLSLDSFSQ